MARKAAARGDEYTTGEGTKKQRAAGGDGLGVRRLPPAAPTTCGALSCAQELCRMWRLCKSCTKCTSCRTHLRWQR